MNNNDNENVTKNHDSNHSTMVKFYESSFSYSYPFSAVSLAYFLRYPNPYATHVLSTDVIDRHFDPSSQRLSTTRLHLKRSKIPPAILKLLPKGILGTGSDAGQSYILEKSVVDVKEGWMKTESRNLEWTGILSVIEKQTYRRPIMGDGSWGSKSTEVMDDTKDQDTNVTTTVTLVSRFGQVKAIANRRKGDLATAGPEVSVGEENAPAPVKKGFFSAWSTSSMQRSIELVGLRRTRDALVKSKDGMNVVLERLRLGGLVEVLDGMRRDREAAFGPDGPWKRA
ncbi:hypothetical protein MMC22_010815 [Lobaria immixta]|nr:hypothetical protein [Lobaria immixta]